MNIPASYVRLYIATLRRHTALVQSIAELKFYQLYNGLPVNVKVLIIRGKFIIKDLLVLVGRKKC